MNAIIAIPYSDGQVFPHFGKATSFRIYSVVDDKVDHAETLDTDGTSHEDVALWLVWHGVNAVLCDGIGPGAQGALYAAGIQTLAGVSGPADEVVERLLAGTLEAVSQPTCGGHGHGGGCGGHGGCGGSCGHGCGGCSH